MGTALIDRPSCRRTRVFHWPDSGIGPVVRYTPPPSGTSRSTCRPPPCHAVIVTHDGDATACAGETVTRAPAVRCATSPRTSVRATDTCTPWGTWTSRPFVTDAAITTSEPAKTERAI